MLAIFEKYDGLSNGIWKFLRVYIKVVRGLLSAFKNSNEIWKQDEKIKKLKLKQNINWQLNKKIQTYIRLLGKPILVSLSL